VGLDELAGDEEPEPDPVARSAGAVELRERLAAGIGSPRLRTSIATSSPAPSQPTSIGCAPWPCFTAFPIRFEKT
jgi:hypothetical protein